MDDPSAREALRTLIVMLYRAQIRDADIDQLLSMCPPDWPFLTVKVKKSDGKPRLKVGRAEREPGKNSGDNSVITSMDIARTH